MSADLSKPADTPFHDCYACGGTVPGDAAACPGCGALQTRIAYDAFRTVRAAEARVERWKFTAVVSVILAFVLGAGLAIWTSPAQRPTEGGDPEATAAMTRELALEEIHDVFKNSLNQTFDVQNAPLRIVAAVTRPDSGVTLEMAPPTRGQPAVTWQALSTQERLELMAFVGIAYTKALATAGRPVDLARGHPVVALKFHNVPGELAVRGADGKIRVFQSPYDPTSATSAPAAAAPTDAANALGAAAAPRTP